MDVDDFEGSEVLERIAEIDKIDEFFEALDSDDFQSAERLMKAARLSPDQIATVLSKMEEASSEH